MAARTWSCQSKDETHSALVVQDQKCLKQYTVYNKDVSNHHELLKLVEGVVVSPSLEELAGGNEIAAARLQGGIKFFQHALEGTEASPLQTGLQQTLQKHLLWAFLPRSSAKEACGGNLHHAAGIHITPGEKKSSKCWFIWSDMHRCNPHPTEQVG